MSIQFAGSKSSDDRRRRRLVVNADELGADGTGDEGTSALGVSSELVKSSAAAPWVPASEFRLWTYAALIGLMISGAAFALATPISFRPELAPLTKHLLEGDRPALAVFIQTAFYFLCAQLALLIGWYRAQCKLDFRGRYRVWPWAAAVFGLTAVCSATNAHWLGGEIAGTVQLVKWRPAVVSWLVPLAVVASPLILLIDRDVRRSRSSLYTLRMAWLLLMTSFCLELFASDLAGQSWAARARIIVPLFAVSILFTGLWLHARTVAYICPDPPERDGVSTAGRVWSLLGWVASRLVWKRTPQAVEAEADVKPKRGRKKATTDEEEEAAAPKRKRKAPAKRTTKPRTRKVAEVEEEEVEEEEPTYSEEAETVEAADSYEAEEAESEESDEWQEDEPTPPPAPVQSNRFDKQKNSVPAPHVAANKFGNSSKNTWNEPEPVAETDSSEDDDSDESDSEGSSGSDPMRGLSKRQKRELRRQNKQRR